MILVNGGIPRSGTVLVGEWLRRLAHHHGHDAHRFSPQERRHLPNLRARIETHPAEAVLLVHTHLIDAACLAALAQRTDAVLLWNHRDPRDALVSLMRLHEMDLAAGLHAMEVYLSAADLAAAAPGVVTIRYEDLIATPARHLAQIAARTGWPVAPEVAERILAETSPAEHSALMRDLATPGRANTRTLPTLRRTLREDRVTLINDRHIQSGQPGRWRNELDADAQAAATRRLGPWIARLGYAPE